MVLQEKGNISARGRLAGAKTGDMQRDHVKQYDGEGFISHKGLKGDFLRAFIQTSSGG